MKYRFKKIIFIFSILIIFLSIYKVNDIEKIFYPTKYSKIVERYSDKYKVDKYLVYSIIKTESKFNPNAKSHKDAKGLMQITDKTAQWIAKEIKLSDYDLYSPDDNINIGTWYLSRLQREFNNNLNLIIPAYNGGSGNVRKWLNSTKYSEDGKTLKNIPFKETYNYTNKVLENYEKYRKIYEK